MHLYNITPLQNQDINKDHLWLNWLIKIYFGYKGNKRTNLGERITLTILYDVNVPGSDLLMELIWLDHGACPGLSQHQLYQLLLMSFITQNWQQSGVEQSAALFCTQKVFIVTNRCRQIDLAKEV